MTDLDLCYLPAGEALRRFKARELSPVELMQAVIERAEEIAPKINPFADRSRKSAYEDPCTIPNTSGRPSAGCPSHHARHRAAHRNVRSRLVDAASCVQGCGGHSSNAITISDPRSR